MDLAIAFLIPFKASVLSSPTTTGAAGRGGGGGGDGAVRGGGDLAFPLAGNEEDIQVFKRFQPNSKKETLRFQYIYRR